MSALVAHTSGQGRCQLIIEAVFLTAELSVSLRSTMFPLLIFHQPVNECGQWRRSQSAHWVLRRGGRWALIISNLITGRPHVRSDEWAAAHWMK